MKENAVWLSPQELQHMLQGSLQWNDVEDRVTSSKMGIIKLGETLFEKQSTTKQTVQKGYYRPKGNEEEHLKRLEGQSVIWLLGIVGLLTLSSWLFFVLFS